MICWAAVAKCLARHVPSGLAIKSNYFASLSNLFVYFPITSVFFNMFSYISIFFCNIYIYIYIYTYIYIIYYMYIIVYIYIH